MAAVNKYDAIIIDSDIETRMRLKQATTAVVDFGKVQQLGDAWEAIAKLKGKERCDVVFISSRLGKEDTTNFIRDAKSTPQGQDAAYVLVLKGEQDSGTVAHNVMLGADGFLVEPYSVDQLTEITALAARVRRERSQAREEAALRFLLSDIMKVGRSTRKFKDLCGVLLSLQGDSRELYYQVAIDMFESAPPPRRIVQAKRYSGASSRVKKQIEDKLLDELEKEFGTVK
jgi:DNA-binding NarL/FixJ family response regulator